MYSFALLSLQVFATFGILLIIYLAYALQDIYEADFANEIGFLIFQPLFGFVYTSITILACCILGLPIRLITRVRQWWTRRPFIPLLGLLIGLIFFVLSFKTNLMETKQIVVNGELMNKTVPNFYLSLIGWFLTAFCLLHLYPTSLLSLFRKRTI